MHAHESSLLRPRHGSAPVTQIELFFDLVFVFAVTQLSLELRQNLSLAGLLHTVMLFAAIWWAWVHTSWITNWLDPLNRAVRGMLLALMLLALVLAAALPGAFGGRGLAFAAAFAALQLGRTGFMLWALHGSDATNFRNFQRIAVWFTIAAVLWIAGGLAPSGLRTGIWLAALAVDLAGPACGFFTPGLGRSTTAEWNIDPRHLAERCAGFILIALGESITVTGAAFFELGWTGAVLAAFAGAFCGAVALWWIYFDDAAERTATAFASSADPGRVARAAYTYVHALLVAGIIATAAGNAALMARPLARATTAELGLMLGGPALYLAGNGIFRRLLHPRFPPSHILGLALLVALAAASPWLCLLTLSWGIAAVLGAVILRSSDLVRRQRRA
jgi:low temperature requirement protein LtrA